MHVLHLAGSAVDDGLADLSRLYARDALAALAGDHRHSVAWVSPDGRWRFPADLERDSIAAAEPVEPGRAVARVAALGVDLMLPQMFCRPGMTSYRALFDVLGVPYLGNTAQVMALAAHKARAKAVVAAAGVAVPAGELLGPGDRPTIAPPAVVKPVDADNSDGVTLVRTPGGYAAALAAAFAHSGEVLVESYVELGREVRCGVIERDGELVALPLEEYAVHPDRKPVRDRADKLARDPDGELRLVAKDPSRAWIVDAADPLTGPVQAAARACHVALGCRHYGLFDFRVDPAGRPWFLEAGPYCSYSGKSVLAVMARAAGLSVPELFRIGVRQVFAPVATGHPRHMFDELQKKLGLSHPGREDDVTDDDHLAHGRDTGGAGDGTGDAESTTGTGTSEDFVGRVAGQDDGAERLTGAEARAFGADERGDGTPDVPSGSGPEHH